MLATLLSSQCLRLLIFFLLFHCVVAAADDKNLCNENCTFVLKKEDTENYVILNEVRSKKRFSPFSTFKILNSLVALELGVVESLEQELSFEKSSYPVQQWWPEVWYQNPLNLKEAFQYSAVPIYQQIAGQIGEGNMKKYVSGFKFGNTDISSGIDVFWLNGSLQVSAKEQVDFLHRLNRRQFLVSDIAIVRLKDIMLVEATKKYKLYAKTGGGRMDNGRALGWYVGFVETKTEVYYFALNIEAETFDELKDARIEITREQLRQAGVI